MMFSGWFKGKSFPGWLLIVLAAGMLVLSAGCGSQAESHQSAQIGISVSSGDAPRQGQEKQDTKSYRTQDLGKLQHTEYFARGAIEHIFVGNINKKGKAGGFHYNGIEDSAGRIIEGTQSKKDKNGVFTAEVEVSGTKKNGFSSFYPEDWSPQEVVDAINTAYEEALDDPDNPHGDLWIGHAGKLEIDMYLNDKQKIVSAFPVKQKK